MGSGAQLELELQIALLLKIGGTSLHSFIKHEGANLFQVEKRPVLIQPDPPTHSYISRGVAQTACAAH